MARIRIVTTRAPGLIPSLIKEIDHASNPVVLIPESFTLACETEIVNRSRDKGIFGLKVFSPSSLVREVRELTGHGSKKPVSADGQNMIVSQVLHHHHDELKYYRDSIAQPTLAQKIASQINDFTRARLSADFLREFQPSSKRTQAKLEDMALVWDGYTQALGDRFEDGVGQWLSAVDNIVRSGLIRNAQLLIYGFDYLPAIQRKRNSSMDTQGKDAFDIRALRKNISESTRLLYVAMTRAQQKLCLVGSVKDGEETLWSNQTRAARIWKTRSMLDMIMPAVLQRVDLPDVGETAEDDLWRVACVSGKVIEEGAEEERASASGIEEILTKEEPMLMYLPEKVEPAPLKTSVTTLTRQAPVLSDDDSEETVEDKRKTEEAVRTFRLSSVASRPAFLEEEKVEAVNVGKED